MDTLNLDIVLNNHQYRTIAEIITYLNSIDDRRHRFRLQKNYLHQIIDIYSVASDTIDRLYTYIKNDSSWSYTISPQKFNKRFEYVEQIIIRAREDRNRLEKAKREISRIWKN